jgi:hypothetical protein
MGRFDDGFCVFLYPEGNGDCASAVGKYRECLTSEDTFAAWTLEEVVAAIDGKTDAMGRRVRGVTSPDKVG